MDTRSFQLVCRTCLRTIKGKEKYATADTITEYGKIIDVLETCVSELNLDLTNDVVLCKNCIMMLRISYSFKLKCLHTEDAVFTYLQNNNLKLYNRINLVDMINSTGIINLQNKNQMNHVNEKLSDNNELLPHTTDSSDNFVKKNKKIKSKRNESREENTELTDTNMIKGSSNNDIVMSENLPSSKSCETGNINESNTITNVFRTQETSGDELILRENSNRELQERCRLNSCKEDYVESLFRMAPMELLDDDFEDLIFRAS